MTTSHGDFHLPCAPGAHLEVLELASREIPALWVEAQSRLGVHNVGRDFGNFPAASVLGEEENTFCHNLSQFTRASAPRTPGRSRAGPIPVEVTLLSLCADVMSLR